MPTIRKVYGSDPFLYTGERLIAKNPHYVKSLVVEKEDRDQEKILLFFREDNVDPEAARTEPRVSMLAQLCKGDAGSASSDGYYQFSTALKSRLMCGYPRAGQYYPHLQDIFLLRGRTGDQSQVYGLFTNSWNQSAVCSYNVGDIESLFITSPLRGAQEEKVKNLSVRPGTCLPAGTRTPEDTFMVISRHPEVTEWVEPSGKDAVFQTSSHYTKMAVDEVMARDGKRYRIILLATDDGAVHKVVELDDGAMNVLETRPFQHPGEIVYMELDPKEHALYVGSPREVARLALDTCGGYEQTCEGCVLSRDPYCGWTGSACGSVLNSTGAAMLQNITHGSFSKCTNPKPHKQYQGPAPGEGVRHGTRYFLTSPALSEHATYSWTRDGQDLGHCAPHNGSCTLLLLHVTEYGRYQCLAQEGGAQRVVAEHFLARDSGR
ncbi:semaphorin-7A [Ascaphus truei]|uniref:semaphorin-7A n=1 Tax=Ascaphus truei TaxID=8439 RepID=UPI003F598C89